MTETKMTLQQLRVFWAVVHSPSLTQAAKQLGLSQPALSQQLARLEQNLGGRLFERTGNQLILGDAGRYVLRKAETILAEVDEIETGFAAYREGQRGRIAVGALSSLARALLPPVGILLQSRLPQTELDVHELTPKEALDALYGRTIHVALISSGSVAENRTAFSQIPIAEDPYVLAVPQGLDLERVAEPERDLDELERDLLTRTIVFDFGNQHNLRMEDLHRRLLGHHRAVACCRTYDTALAMVEGGLGIAVVPQLTAEMAGRRLFDVRLYAMPLPPRSITAFLPSQYRHLKPYAQFLEALRTVGQTLRFGPLLPTPPFLRARLEAPTLA